MKHGNRKVETKNSLFVYLYKMITYKEKKEKHGQHRYMMLTVWGGPAPLEVQTNDNTKKQQRGSHCCWLSVNKHDGEFESLLLLLLLLPFLGHVASI